MELSRLSRKEIINLYDGERLGFVGESDLIIDDQAGSIQAIVISPRSLGIKFGRNPRELVIPWECVKKIGEEVLIVEISPSRGNRRYGGHE